jgi:hypothetical protein
MDLQEMVCDSVDWVHLIQDRLWWLAPVHTVVSVGGSANSKHIHLKKLYFSVKCDKFYLKTFVKT